MDVGTRRLLRGKVMDTGDAYVGMKLGIVVIACWEDHWWDLEGKVKIYIYIALRIPSLLRKYVL